MDRNVDQREWLIRVTFVEDDVTTRARAVLDDGRGRTVAARGVARRNPVDPSMPRVGEELAAARSLSELAHELVADATATLDGTPRGHVELTATVQPIRHLPVERELIHPGG